MKDYFFLQYKMANRKLKEAGINPLLGYILGLMTLILISEYFFHKTDFAKYLVVLACLGFLFKLSEKSRTDFLLSTFGNKRKRQLRVIENLIVFIPFAAILIFKNAFYESALLLALSIISATFSFQTFCNFPIPTPFSKNPFEFTVGFRKSFFIFPIAYSLTIIAISVDNLNLGVFSMLLVFLISMTYYTKPENEYYVWIHANTPKTFLLEKIKAATKNVFILDFPVLLSLLFFFPVAFELILLFFVAGIFYLWTIILSKYSAYPQEMNLPEGILIAFSIYFPPLLLAVMPFFFNKSINNLKLILNDKD